MPIRSKPTIINRETFRAATTEGLVARGLLGIAIATTLWHTISGEVPLLNAVKVDPRRSSLRRERFWAAEDHYQSTWLISFLTLTVAALAVIWWARQAYANRKNQDLSPSQIVVALLMPFANTYLLRQLLVGFTDDKRPHKRHVAWWTIDAMFVLAVIASIVTFLELGLDVDKNGGSPGLVAMFMAASLMQATAMALLIYLIGAVNRIQLAAFNEDVPEPAAPPPASVVAGSN